MLLLRSLMFLQGAISLSQWMLPRCTNADTSIPSPQPFSIDEIDVCGQVFPQPLATDRLIMDTQAFLANIVVEDVGMLPLIIRHFMTFLDRMTYVRAFKCHTPTSVQSRLTPRRKMSQRVKYR